LIESVCLREQDALLRMDLVNGLALEQLDHGPADHAQVGLFVIGAQSLRRSKASLDDTLLVVPEEEIFADA